MHAMHPPGASSFTRRAALLHEEAVTSRLLEQAGDKNYGRI